MRYPLGEIYLGVDRSKSVIEILFWEISSLFYFLRNRNQNEYFRQNSESMFQVNKSRGEKLKREKCACGDVLCSAITQFLNTSKWNKCWYKRPKEFGDKFPHKRRRSELVHNQFMLWRKEVSKNPSYQIFINEINDLCLMHAWCDRLHVDILKGQQIKNQRNLVDLMRFTTQHYFYIIIEIVRDYLCRWQWMSDAVKFGMYKEEFTYVDKRTRKLRILTIPMVNSHQALQVTTYIITV